MPLHIESTSSPRSEELVRIFLRHHHSGVLATSSSAGNPHAAVIYYVLDDDLSILFGTKSETQKYKNMEENKRVALAVYDESMQSIIQVMGGVEFVDDKRLREKVLSHMGKVSMEVSAENIPPAAKLEAGDYMIVRIIPNVIKLAEYGFAKPGSDDLFETVVFGSD